MSTSNIGQLKFDILEQWTKLPLFRSTLDLDEILFDNSKLIEFRELSLTTFDKFDHSPHPLFVEMHVLTSVKRSSASSNGELGESLVKRWRETGRWIKYEESLEDHGHDWGKPRIPSIYFHSLANLRRLLIGGLVLLDVDAKDFKSLAGVVIKELKEFKVGRDIEVIEENLGLKHEHVKDSDKIWSLLQSMNLEEGGKARRGSKNSSRGDFKIGLDNEDYEYLGKESDLMRRVPRNGECALILVGKDDGLATVTSAFVRLSQTTFMPKVSEIPIPVRFVFIVLGPGKCEINFREIGRCMAVLIDNDDFKSIAYKCRKKQELLHGLNEFLDSSVIVPHRDYDYGLLNPTDLRRRSFEIQKRKGLNSSSVLEIITEEEAELTKKVEKVETFTRSGRLFGGLLNDVVFRFKMYKSDILDGVNFQCVAAIFYIFFAAVAGTIAMGRVLSARTFDSIGITESVIGTSTAGVLFSLLSCQPILIIGTSGSSYVFDDSLFKFCRMTGLEVKDILALRTWVGLWLFFIGLLVACFEGSILARYFTRFVQEIFAVYISLVFITESFFSLQLIFKKHPMDNEPNLALYSVLIYIATFVIAWFLRTFKTGDYGTKLVRKLLGNFAVLLSILSVSLIHFGIHYTTPILRNVDYLNITDASRGLHTSLPSRGWFITPLTPTLPIWAIFAAIFPAMLLYILIFIEVLISELIVGKRENCLKKGCGFHWDVMLLCMINTLMGYIGSSWMSSAIVRSVTHLSALTVFSTNNPPGVKPDVIGVKEQRVTGVLVSFFLGCALLMSRILKYIPMAVLFGIFLFMGISSIIGVQFIERIFLIFKEKLKQPDVPYVTQVRMWKMHSYTLIQISAIVIIWTVKESQASLIVPILIVLLIPFRLLILSKMYNPKELQALDGKGGDDDKKLRENGESISLSKIQLPRDKSHISIHGSTHNETALEIEGETPGEERKRSAGIIPKKTSIPDIEKKAM